MNRNEPSMNPARVHHVREYAIGPKPADGKGASPMGGKRRLREMAREAIDAGALPSRRPDSMWGGKGSGSRCSICGVPVTRDELEIELEFSGDDCSGEGTFHVHVPCLAAWEREFGQTATASRTA
jgi:hypothetical protein